MTAPSIQGQTSRLQITTKKDRYNHIISNLNYTKAHTNKTSIYQEIDTIIYKLEAKGFLNAVVDTIYNNDTLYTAELSLGIQTKYIRITHQHISDTILSKRFLQSLSSNSTQSYIEMPFGELKITLQQIANQLENLGYAFTEVSLKEITFENDLAIAELNISTTRSRTIDKVIIKGYTNFPKGFIENELQLKIGSKFNSSKLKDASIAINKIKFAEEQKPPEVLFTRDSTYVYLYLKKKASNKFDGIVGFASQEEKSGLEFNGYIDLELNNIFNRGETFALFWKNNGNDSQRFFINTELPYPFGLPLIPKIHFELFRQDSTFNSTLTQIDLSYALNSQNTISASFHTKNSNDLIQASNSNIESFKNIFYGFNYNLTKASFDNLFPVRFQMALSAYFGHRQTDKNKENQTKFLLNTHYLWSIDTKNHIFIQNQSALLNSTNYFENELYRLGGANNLRGFSEESIFASTYSIFNLEYRYRPAATSYFYTISDFAYTDNKQTGEITNLMSFGLGYVFSTKVGWLNLSYAIGKFKESPFLLNNSMLHIQITNNF
ncbi:MAG: hypothetical protein OEM04_03945 [Flavobacteriaceae bacterium]|nr:hypothetical protein [Flavobacteriaceae bacterium]